MLPLKVLFTDLLWWLRHSDSDTILPRDLRARDCHLLRRPSRQERLECDCHFHIWLSFVLAFCLTISILSVSQIQKHFADSDNDKRRPRTKNTKEVCVIIE